jgi:hypothetical protein
MMAPAKKHKRVAFLMPGGAVINHDRVVAYHQSEVTKIVDANINIGDTFVFEAALRLCDFEHAVYLSGGFKDVGWARDLLDSCEVAILRGSNYIHPGMEWGNLPLAIEQSKTPVVAFGIGAQAPRYQDISITATTRHMLQLISDRSASIGCRGQFTVDTLKKLGINNAIPIGCPSLFRLNDRGIQIPWGEASPPRRIGFTLGRGLGGMYCDDLPRTRSQQIELLDHLRQNFEVYVLSQNEKAEKIFHYRIYERMEEAKKLMASSGWGFDKYPWLEELYWHRIFFGTSPADYERMARFCDLAVGYRLHGNIMFLSCGKPAIYQTYDSRTRELVEHFNIPSHDVMGETPFALESLFEQPIFEKFNARFQVAYDITRDFLEANGVAHRMTYPATG